MATGTGYVTVTATPLAEDYQSVSEGSSPRLQAEFNIDTPELTVTGTIDAVYCHAANYFVPY